MRHRLRHSGLVLAVLMSLVPWGMALGEDAENRVTLPPLVELDKLTDLVSKTLGLSVQFGVGKVAGSVRISLVAPVGGQDLWSIYHQLLASGGYTTVLSAVPPVYQVVTVADAAQQARAFSSAELSKLAFQPGYQVVLYDLKHVSAEAALKAMTTLISGPGVQLRTLAGQGRQFMLAAPATRQQEAVGILKLIDLPGREPVVRLVRPERTTLSTLQASVIAAWTAVGRIGENARQAEVLIAPDGLQLLLVAAANDMDLLERVVHDLDRSEPVELRTYRPQFFALDEVANLIAEAVGGESRSATATKAAGATSSLEVVRDNLTGSLLIKATSAQHQRIVELLKTLENVPASGRRQTKAIQVKHRRADEISRLIVAMVAAYDGRSEGTGTESAQPGGTGAGAGSQPAGSVPLAPGNPTSPPGTSGAPYPPMAGGFPSGLTSGMGGSVGSVSLPTPVPSAVLSVARSADGSLLITADPVTNRLIVLGEPRLVSQVEALVQQLDQYQPQVDLEFILVSLTEDQSREVGVELVRQFSSDGTNTNISSLFGLSQAPISDATLRTIGNASGLGTVVLRPGEYAAVLRALESLNDGRSVIRSQLVVNNNAQASLNGVIQQPISSVNSSTQVATTSYAGTSDAGTQITVSPQISPADYITLAYTVSQSSFLGQPIVTETGVIPPTKRNDNVSSIATVPDGHVIALGGLSNQSTGSSESRIPLLGSIPMFGNLFKSRRDSGSMSRFLAFIRVSILRRTNFEDLRYLSEQRMKEAALGDEGEPTLRPQFIR